MKLNELSALMNVFSKKKNKTRVETNPNVSFTDYYRANPVQHLSKKKQRLLKRKANKNQYKRNNDRFIKNLLNISLTENDKKLLSKGLRFIPTSPKPISYKSLLKDFNNFTRNVSLKYHFADHGSNPHPTHVKSTWQPPLQPSVALESYLERTKLEIASISFSNAKGNLSAQERQAISALHANTKVNIKI